MALSNARWQGVYHTIAMPLWPYQMHGGTLCGNERAHTMGMVYQSLKMKVHMVYQSLKMKGHTPWAWYTNPWKWKGTHHGYGIPNPKNEDVALVRTELNFKYNDRRKKIIPNKVQAKCTRASYVAITETEYWTGRNELNWTELSWTELNWTELNWTELNWTELNWTELNWTERNWTELWI